MIIMNAHVPLINSTLPVLFSSLKHTKTNLALSEVYKRTYDHMFNYIYPKVSITSDTSIIVQDVYRVLCTMCLSNSKEKNILKYLERIADRCLIHHSLNSTKSKVYA